MKIHSDALVQAIWTMQLKKLSYKTLHKYVGDRFGLVPNEDTWYINASDIHVCERHLITDKLGKQQAYKRVRKLIEEKYLSWGYRDLTFFINTTQAKAAFVVSRDFWLSKGVPEGQEEQRSLCVPLDNYQQLKQECFELLQKKFKSVDWTELTEIASKD
jgi:hypothetical protein